MYQSRDRDEIIVGWRDNGKGDSNINSPNTERFAQIIEKQGKQSKLAWKQTD